MVVAPPTFILYGFQYSLCFGSMVIIYFSIQFYDLKHIYYIIARSNISWYSIHEHFHFSTKYISARYVTIRQDYII